MDLCFMKNIYNYQAMIYTACDSKLLFGIYVPTEYVVFTTVNFQHKPQTVCD